MNTEQPSDEDIDELTQRIIGAAMDVHREMGPGLLESVYKTCMVLELRARGIDIEIERRVPLEYREQPIDSYMLVDLIVQRTVVVEIKAVTALAAVHSAQVLTYLRLTGCPAGLLLNFNVAVLKDGIRRLNHPHRYMRRRLPLRSSPPPV